jgi:hypothetical protein
VGFEGYFAVADRFSMEKLEHTATHNTSIYRLRVNLKIHLAPLEALQVRRTGHITRELVVCDIPFAEAGSDCVGWRTSVVDAFTI